MNRTYPRTVAVGDHEIELSRLTAEDRDDVVAFARGLEEEDLLFLRTDITKKAVVDAMIAAEGDERRVTVLARDQGELVGYGAVTRDAASWTRHLGEIRVIVAPSHRGIGLGARLGREIFAIAKELGLRKLIARMPIRQEGARRMFEQIGFSAEALLADWVVDRKDRTHDLVVMSHDVTSLT